MLRRNEVKEIMENELRCVQWASTGCCDRDCAKCPLLRDTSDIMQAYGYVIKVLEEDVSCGVYDQVRWERDVAIEQLKELGYSLGETVREN